jgi:hypothetical protein
MGSVCPGYQVEQETRFLRCYLEPISDCQTLDPNTHRPREDQVAGVWARVCHEREVSSVGGPDVERSCL